MRSVSCTSLTLAALVVMLSACGVARELEQPSRVGACTECHGFPPAEPSAIGLSHPDDANCVSCHGTTVDARNDLIAGGTHFDGRVDLSGHELPYLEAHTTAALAAIASCTPCHGADYGGGAARSCTACHEAQLGFSDWRTNCTFCHGTRTAGLSDAPGFLAAPPQTVAGTGGQTSASPRVGAHQAHLAAGTYSAPLACGSCHAVPAQTFPGSLDHLDGRAVVQFSAVARQGVANPSYAAGSCAVYCHGSTFLLGGGKNTTPAWTSTGGLACDACHTLSPTSGFHEFHLARAVACASCHPGYSIEPPSADTSTHVNGTFDAAPITTAATFSSWPTDCGACHPTGIP